MKVAIVRFGDTVAPVFEYAATISIFTVHRRRVVDRTDFALQSREPLDRVRLLRAQAVEPLICGGVQSFFEDMLVERGVQVFSWVSGHVDDLLEQFVSGRLVRGGGADRPPAGAKREVGQR